MKSAFTIPLIVRFVTVCKTLKILSCEKLKDRVDSYRYFYHEKVIAKY